MDSVRSNRRSPRLHGNGPQETIEILSSDDEDSSSETSVSKVSHFEVQHYPPLPEKATLILPRVLSHCFSKVDFARILLNGALKSDKNCSILFRGDSRTFELSFKVGRRIKTLTIPQDEISQCYAFEPSNHHGHVDTTYSDRLTLLLDLGITAVLLLMVDSRVFDSQKITSPRKDANKKEESVLIQFEKVEGYYDLLTSMEDAGQIVQSAGPEIEEIEGLIEAVQKVRKTRNSGTPSKKKNPFSSGKAKDDILFVYPFGEERSKIEEAAQGLEIFSAKPHGNENAEGTASSTSSNSVGFRQRSHFITIRIEDYDRLESEVWLNDSLVDFFMLWISRDIHNIHASDVHFFTSHFYSTLTKKGSEGVTTWTAKKNIDIFQKKLIFIPINKSLHWSLCVVVNPGEICRYKPGQETNKMPCLICFDSLKMHCPRQTKRKIMDWLNSEWARIRGTTGNGPFVDGSFKVFTPEGRNITVVSKSDMAIIILLTFDFS
jgi:Ulp1 protease family, C-terminal catalytic domain